MDAGRELVVVGTNRPIPLREYYGTTDGGAFFVDIAGDGAGTYQPIFHIDMFVTLVGRDADGAFTVLVGSPALGDEILGTRSPYSLDDVYDSIADQLKARGMNVLRNPLVHRPEVGRSFTVAQLRTIGGQPGNEALLEPIDREMQSLWERQGFTVHLLGDFNPFARRQGVVHCIKRYLRRGD